MVVFEKKLLIAKSEGMVEESRIVVIKRCKEFSVSNI
jgi:hypothetical protein